MPTLATHPLVVDLLGSEAAARLGKGTSTSHDLLNAQHLFTSKTETCTDTRTRTLENYMLSTTVTALQQIDLRKDSDLFKKLKDDLLALNWPELRDIQSNLADALLWLSTEAPKENVKPTDSKLFNFIKKVCDLPVPADTETEKTFTTLRNTTATYQEMHNGDRILSFCKFWTNEIMPLFDQNEVVFWRWVQKLVEAEKFHNGHDIYRKAPCLSTVVIRKYIVDREIFPSTNITPFLERVLKKLEDEQRSKKTIEKKLGVQEDPTFDYSQYVALPTAVATLTTRKAQEKAATLFGVSAREVSKNWAESSTIHPSISPEEAALQQGFLPDITASHLDNLAKEIFSIFKKHVAPALEKHHQNAATDIFIFVFIKTTIYEDWVKQYQQFIKANAHISSADAVKLLRQVGKLANGLDDKIKANAPLMDAMTKRIDISSDQKSMLSKLRIEFEKLKLPTHVILALFDSNEVQSGKIEPQGLALRIRNEMTFQQSQPLPDIDTLAERLHAAHAQQLPELVEQIEFVRVISMIRAVRYLIAARAVNSVPHIEKYMQHLKDLLVSQNRDVASTPKAGIETPQPGTPRMPSSPEFSKEDLREILATNTSQYILMASRLSKKLGVDLQMPEPNLLSQSASSSKTTSDDSLYAAPLAIHSASAPALGSDGASVHKFTLLKKHPKTHTLPHTTSLPELDHMTTDLALAQPSANGTFKRMAKTLRTPTQ